jgi:16S rRNA G966 N2-methylase RsmD
MALYKDFDFSLLDTPEFKEDSVREELIKPLLDELGYSSSGPNKIIRSLTLRHPFVRIGSSEKKVNIVPDYLLTVKNVNAWILDAKSPNECITDSGNIEQVYSYAIHPEIKVKYFALCNGKEFILYRIDSSEAKLSFNLSEVDKWIDKLKNLLSPNAFILKPQISQESEKEIGLSSYTTIKPLKEVVSIHKQAAKRHFGVHGYFTKQSWEIVDAYILNFTKPNDLVLDPYGGSGVTLIESLMLRRRAINVDINPLSIFIVQNLLRPVDINELNKEFKKIKEQYLAKEAKTNTEIESYIKKYPYPKNIKLPKASDVDSIEKLFSTNQLANLAFLKHLIRQINNDAIQNSLLLAFSSTITKINLTYHSSSTRDDNAGNAAAFAYYRYRLAVKPIELDIMNVFETKVKKLIAAKLEIQPIVTSEVFNNAEIYKGDATNLNKIHNETVDYIYTDPPYGSNIPYLDLSTMWNAWLDLKVEENDFKREVIEGGEHAKTKDNYSKLLAKSIGEMYRVLKYDRWMSFVFAHKDPAYWHLIVNSAENAGFEYKGAIKQKTGQQSFKKRQHPFTVLSGQLIINFQKARNPKIILKVGLNTDIKNLVLETIESVIAAHDGATLEEINDELVIRGLELGFLDILGKEYEDITPLLNSNFHYDNDTQKYGLRENESFKTHIDIGLRIRYFLLSYLRRLEHENKYPTFDEIILNIMPLLKNGDTPEHQTIQNVLETLADRINEDQWKLKSEGLQQILL